MANRMRVVVRNTDDARIQVLQSLVDGYWVDIDEEVVPEWAIAQSVTLGSTDWTSKFAAWITSSPKVSSRTD